MRGKLFTQDYLEEGITETAAWRKLDEAEVAAGEARLAEIFQAFPVTGTPNEATTEQDLILPVLEALGWEDFLPQQTTSRRGRVVVPDVLLFAEAAAKRAAQAEEQEQDRYRHGAAIVESKRWGRPLDRALDRADSATASDAGAPSTQMLRYLSRAETASHDRIRWGILTNGRYWRLYFQGARSRSEEFLELDLTALLNVPDLPSSSAATATNGANAALRPEDDPERRAHYLQVFLLLFGRRAFLRDPAHPEGWTLHLQALDESRRWEERVSTDLGAVVFERVFPDLLAALIEHDPDRPDPPTAAYLDEVRRAGLTFLYRLLFLLFAEDRNLLPAQDPRYDDYSLRRIRLELGERLDERDTLSTVAAHYYHHLQDLFRAVGQGDPSLGVPPYDGGLFEADRHPLVDRVRLPDAALGPLIDALSRREEGDRRRWINYRDLSVQHLGSVYERLLQFEPLVGEDGAVGLKPNPFARKGSGSYYTHDDLVRLILRKTLEPLLAEIDQAFAESADELGRSRRPKAERLAELRRLDPASRILELKVCDPAMGSGHFLVSLVDFLADQALERIGRVEGEVAWAPDDAPYRSPVEERIRAIRETILSSAEEAGWALEAEQLDDRHVIRRILLKRVIYGVDKNAMAVELAKVALWLHTFTAGAPLSFLDHHLRNGDSLYGEWLDDASEEFGRVASFFFENVRVRIAQAGMVMNEIAELSDTDIAEVRQSRELFGDAEEALEPLRRVLDLWHALLWLSPKGRRAGLEHPGAGPLIRGSFGDLESVLMKGEVSADKREAEADAEAVNDLLAQVRRIAQRERFLHWELAFPTVWRELDRRGGRGGFDAVIGNPPWDRLKLQEVEWFAAREPEIARSPRAADRKRKVQQLEKRDAPLWREYLEAREAAETAARVARESGHYPQLARGDLNIYSLFVERAQRLVHPRGVVGFLVPSGIASDLSASDFFQAVATGGRLRALYDFENKKVFFPDVHASFKFSAFVFGGDDRSFAQADCAFFLHAMSELDEPERSFPLGPKDFAAVNPNTGTAPVFRSRRDAEITTGVYRRLPILVKRSDRKATATWPVEYVRMFDMTNDSGLFKTRPELDAEGWYPVTGNRWRKGEAECVPLYVGRMIHHFDHRAASVEVNPNNLHNVAYSRSTTQEEHRNPEYAPTSQYWIEDAHLRAKGFTGSWALAFRDIARATDERTIIATIIPSLAAGNTLPLLLPEARAKIDYATMAPLLLAQMNSFAFDFIARQKVQTTHANWYIVEQMPVLPPKRFEETLGARPIGDFVREQVLRLSYTAVDLAPMARDLGYQGDPFPWDEVDRRHRQAHLDALFFHLYGIDRAAAAYILDQFPIVQREDQQVHGRYFTKDLILAYMNAVAAGDLETRVTV